MNEPSSTRPCRTATGETRADAPIQPASRMLEHAGRRLQPAEQPWGHIASPISLHRTVPRSRSAGAENVKYRGNGKMRKARMGAGAVVQSDGSAADAMSSNVLKFARSPSCKPLKRHLTYQNHCSISTSISFLKKTGGTIASGVGRHFLEDPPMTLFITLSLAVCAAEGETGAGPAIPFIFSPVTSHRIRDRQETGPTARRARRM